MSKTNELNEKILKSVQDLDIASLYMLEKDIHENFDEESINGYYTNILDIALEKLTQTLQSHRKMDMEDVQDFATIRALYEYAMEHYSIGKTQDASALFEVLSGMTNDDKFSWALKLHWMAALENILLDDFMSNIADIELTQQKGTFYISSFQKEAQKLLDNAQKDGSNI